MGGGRVFGVEVFGLEGDFSRLDPVFFNLFGSGAPPSSSNDER